MQTQEWTPEAAKQYAQNLCALFPRRVIESVVSESESLERYQDDPVGFCEETFGETYTDDIKRVMESVRDFPVTVVKSCNGPGKTHAAARIAAWFIKVFRDAQVYTAAAPPEDNLKRLLW